MTAGAASTLFSRNHSGFVPMGLRYPHQEGHVAMTSASGFVFTSSALDADETRVVDLFICSACPFAETFAQDINVSAARLHDSSTEV